MNITIVIPAFNEEHRIGPTLKKYATFFGSRAELLVVLNGCTDKTCDVVRDVQKQHPTQIALINALKPIGKGAAIVRGWQESSSEVIGFVDADGATSPEEFQKLCDALNGHDGAIASRFLPNAVVKNRQSPLRTAASYSFMTLVKILFQLPYRDTQCGAKIFRRAVLAPLLPSLREKGMLFDVELLVRLHRAGADIVEVPTTWIDQPGSASLGSHKQFFAEGLRMLHGLLRLRCSAKTG